MKTLNYLCIVFFVLFSFPVIAVIGQAPDTLWTKSIGGDGSQAAYDVFPTTDGGFMLGGYTTVSGLRDFYMVKTDGEGSVLWEKNFGEDDRFESSTSMIQTNDGGYILAGSRADDPPYSSKTDIFLVKTDNEGNQDWSCIIGVNDISESAQSIVQTSDGGYAVCGHYWATSQTVYDIFIVKINEFGAEEWTRVINFEDGSAENALAIEQAADGGFLVTGNTQAFSGNYCDNAYILKTDFEGEMVWLQTYGNVWPWYESSYDIIHTSDGGFLICGNQDNDGIDKNWFVVKTDGSGNEIWSDNSIGGTYHDGAFASYETMDGGYAVTGNVHQGVWNPFITKFSVDGDTLWTKMWGTGNDHSQYNYDIKQLDDGGFITAGSTYIPEEDLNVYLSRLTPELVSIETPESNNSHLLVEKFNCQPNPFSSETLITYRTKADMFINISIYNMYGQKIKELVNEDHKRGIYDIEFKGDQISCGMYYCVLSFGDMTLTKKLIHH